MIRENIQNAKILGSAQTWNLRLQKMEMEINFPSGMNKYAKMDSRGKVKIWNFSLHIETSDSQCDATSRNKKCFMEMRFAEIWR